MTFRRVALVVALLVATGCSGGAATPTSTASAFPSGPAEGSAAAVRERLCTRPEPLPPSSAPREGELLPYMREVMAEVERVRGHEFLEPVVPEAITRTDLDARIEDGFAAQYPQDLYERRGLVWQTIGAIPEGTDLRAAYHEFYNTAVIGFYDTLTGELVFLGTDDPMPEERVTLAHELVHALDDQWFDLSKIDRLLADCQEEAFQTALAVVEGSANYHMLRYAKVALTREERWSLGSSGAPRPRVPDFLMYEMAWPYDAGYTWADWAVDSDQLDRSLRDLPTTTEQILHPERWDDVPEPLDVPDLGPALGTGWSDLDVQDAGESWLRSLLQRRIDFPTVEGATTGWDGGLLRSWTDGDHVAVVLETAWDSPGDAEEFARVMADYAEIGQDRPIEVLRIADDPTRVRIQFASDAATLDLLRAAAG
jgi:hypothetical protein